MDIRIEKGSIYNEYNTYGKNIWNSNLRVAAYIRVSTLKEQQQGSFWSRNYVDFHIIIFMWNF